MYGILVLPILYQFIYTRERSRACYLAMSITAYIFFSDLPKLLYAEPRPFWSTDSIEALKCSAQYGQPSGHSMIGVGYTFLVALDITASSGQRAGLLGGSLLYGFSIAYSRFFLGLHSWD